MKLGDALRDAEAQAGATRITAARRLHPIERLEHPLQILRREAGALVAKEQLQCLGAVMHFDVPARRLLGPCAHQTAQIAIGYQGIPAGAELTYSTAEATLVQALHKWFDAQLSDHGRDAMAGPTQR